MYKKSITNSQPFVKKMKNVRSPGGDFFDSHCIIGRVFTFTVAGSSVKKVKLSLNRSVESPLCDSKFQFEGALTLKALANNKSSSAIFNPYTVSLIVHINLLLDICCVLSYTKCSYILIIL